MEDPINTIDNTMDDSKDNPVDNSMNNSMDNTMDNSMDNTMDNSKDIPQDAPNNNSTELLVGSARETIKTFDEFSRAHKNKIVASIVKTINKVSHDNPDQFFRYFLRSQVGKAKILPLVYEEKVKPLMETICDHYKTAVQVHKPTVLSIVANHFIFDELVEFGFPITKSQLECARNKDKKKVRSTMPVEKPAVAKNRLPETTLIKIIQFCLENSKKARIRRSQSNSIQQYNIPGYDTKRNYDLLHTKRVIYEAFKNRYPDLKVSKSSFYKFIPRNFMAPKVLPKSSPKQVGNQLQKVGSNQANEVAPSFNLNSSNFSNNLVTLPSQPDLNYSNSNNNNFTALSASNPFNPNSTMDKFIPPLQPNPNYSNSTSDISVPPPPSNSNNSNPVGNPGFPAPPLNHHYSNMANNTYIPPDNSRSYLNSSNFDAQRPR